MGNAVNAVTGNAESIEDPMLSFSLGVDKLGTGDEHPRLGHYGWCLGWSGAYRQCPFSYSPVRYNSSVAAVCAI
jgi:hypothetical protein